MFKISEFSKLSQVSIKALRYYDQMNLLKPAFIDDSTCYRYYAAEQLVQLNRILAYKELGFTLQQITQLLNEEVSLEQIQGMFRLKKAEIETTLQSEQEKLERLNERLRHLQSEQDIHSQHVILKEVEPLWVASYRKRASLRQIPELFEELNRFLGKSASANQPPMVLWHGCEECEEQIDLEVVRPLNDKITSHLPFSVRHIPETITMATLISTSHNPAEKSPVSCELALWIERNGYRLKEGEPRRELYLSFEPGDCKPLVTEIQIAVEKIAG